MALTQVQHWGNSLGKKAANLLEIRARRYGATEGNVVSLYGCKV
jgi:hypothetical protein